MVDYSFEPDASFGFMYTSGIDKTHPSNVEFICLNVHKDDIMDVASLFK